MIKQPIRLEETAKGFSHFTSPYVYIRYSIYVQYVRNQRKNHSYTAIPQAIAKQAL